VAHIGIIDYTAAWNPFRQGLRDLGYVEGQNLALEYRYTDGSPEQLREVAADLVRRPVDVIATFGTPPTRAAADATKTIPIVMISVGDPVGAGLVGSFARPGGNVTGNTILGSVVVAKRLQLMQELLPGLSRLAYLLNRDNASGTLAFEQLEIVARSSGVTVIPVEVRRGDEFPGALAAMMREHPQALQVTVDPLQQLHIGEIIDFAAVNRVPVMYQSRENVLAGGLVSYGADIGDLFRRAAGYAHRILHGTKPADLPVEQPATFVMSINMKTAKALGLTIAESFMLRADEVIE
jgi:putative ABC transport system substrate-binding protein